MEVAFLILGWAFYFFTHSLFAGSRFKNFVSKKMGNAYRYYRLIYVTFSILGLLLLLFWNATIEMPNFFDNNGIARYLSLMFVAFGVIVIKIAFRAYSLSSFVGLSKEDDKTLTTTGILGSIRHPIYSGTILVAVGFWLFSPNLPTLISVLCILVYIPIGIVFEERKLVEQFGDQYLTYRSRVPALFPRLF